MVREGFGGASGGYCGKGYETTVSAGEAGAGPDIHEEVGSELQVEVAEVFGRVVAHDLSPSLAAAVGCWVGWVFAHKDDASSTRLEVAGRCVSHPLL